MAANELHLTEIIDTQIRKLDRKNMQLERKYMQECAKEKLYGSKRKDLTCQVAVRDAYAARLVNTKMANYKPSKEQSFLIIANKRRFWIPKSAMFVLHDLTDDQIKALLRAEMFVMKENDIEMRNYVEYCKRRNAATCIQKYYRRFVAQIHYKELLERRYAAAVLLQKFYRMRLLRKAISLPPWCELGGQVIVSKNSSKIAGLSFRYYKDRDFPSGTYVKHENITVEQLKHLCRRDDKAAAFASDGTFKRFVPRLLSSLSLLSTRNIAEPLNGLFIKVYPQDNELVRTAIVTQVPTDRSGLIDIVYDGTGFHDRVTLRQLVGPRFKISYDSKTSKRIWTDLNSGKVVQGTSVDVLSQVKSYSDSKEREMEIEKRKKMYEAKQIEQNLRKMGDAAITIQCFWRQKKARDTFKEALKIYQKEREHEEYVAQISSHIRHKEKKPIQKLLKWVLR